MFFELPLSKLAIRGKREAVAFAIEEFLGTAPPESFLERHHEEIVDDDLGFLRRYFGQWPNGFVNVQSRLERGGEAMSKLDGIISIGFLMSVPDEIFLRVAYREFFDREVDQSAIDTYGSRDFASPQSRMELVETLSASREFLERTPVKQIAGPEDFMSRLGPSGWSAIYGEKRDSIDASWFGPEENPSVLTERYVPFLLWIEPQNRFYSLAGMAFGGGFEGNVLQANPEWAIWGPKAKIKAGEYRLRIDLKSPPNDLLIFDVCGFDGTQVFSRIEYFGSLDVTLPLHLPADVNNFEVRLFNYTGRGVKIEIREISLSAW